MCSGMHVRMEISDGKSKFQFWCISTWYAMEQGQYLTAILGKMCWKLRAQDYFRDCMILHTATRG